MKDGHPFEHMVCLNLILASYKKYLKSHYSKSLYRKGYATTDTQGLVISRSRIIKLEATSCVELIFS